MEICFQYTREEFVRAFWMNSKRRMSPKIDAVALFMFVGLGIWSFVENNNLWGWVVFVLAGIFVLILAAARFFIPYFVFSKHIQRRGEYTLGFTKNGIHFKANNIDSALDWSIFTNVLSGAEFYLLYYGKHQFTAIPKRAFKSAEELKDFEDLLNKKLGNIEQN